MKSGHLSDDELIAMLYGLGDAGGHLAGCPECGERWDAMHKALGMARAESAKLTEISARKLATQRLEILKRLENPVSPSLAWRWAPVGAAAFLLAAGLFLHQRPTVANQTPAAVAAEADADLFTDVYSMERDVEPKAAAPIRALFQEASFEPDGGERR